MAQAHYHISEILQMEACTNCCLCAEVCPAVNASGDGHLSGVYRLAQMRNIMRSRKGFLKKFFSSKAPAVEKLKQFGDTVFQCTLCGRCQEVCPSGIMLRDLWVSMRQDMVHSDAYPKKVDMIGKNLAESHNVFDEDNEERADWVDDMRDAPDAGYIREKARVVYFTGCVAAYFPMAQQIPMALAQILERADIDFTLLGEEEWCCGFPMLSAGLRDRVGDFMSHNMEAVRDKGAREVVFACPSCYQMWQEHYPREFDLYHVSQYVHGLIETGRISLGELDMIVTYHDPCDLGRGCGEYDAPRDIIRAIPGLTLVEMAHNRASCLCCGGGGNLEMIDAGLTTGIAGAKVEEALETKAHAIVTSCQQCVRTITTHCRRNKIDMEVLDITQLVQRAMTRQ